MKSENLRFGTSPDALYRNISSDTSIEAAHSVDTTKLEEIVFKAIQKFPDGCIQDDILELFDGYPYSSITARFSALLRKNFIKDTGKKRPGKSGRSQRVLAVV